MKRIEHEVLGIPVRARNINSKNKGNVNERDAAKAMQYWTKKKFVRTPSSGALRWNDNDKVTGDIICDEKGYNFPFTVECKHLKSIPIKDMLSMNSKVYTIWKQASEDAKRAGKLPMALLRCNGMNKFTAPDGKKYQNYYCVLDAVKGGNFLKLMLPIIFTGHNAAKGYRLIGFMFSDLVEKVEPEKFLNLCRKCIVL